MSVTKSSTDAPEDGEFGAPADDREPELLIKEARRRQRLRWSVVASALIAAVVVVTLAVVQFSHVPPTGTGSLLLNTADLPGGWNVKHASTPATFRCTSPPSVSSLLGPNGVGATFQRSGGSPLLFEYLTTSSSAVNAFEKASLPIMTFGSCADNGGGRLLDSSVNDGVIYTTPFGDWSIASLVSNIVYGVHSQLGYLLVRKGNFLMIMGYENKGPLDKKSLESFTRMALAKLPA